MAEQKLKGIGGWLVLFMFILGLNALYYFYDIVLGISMISTFPELMLPLSLESLMVILFGYALFSMLHVGKEGQKGVKILKWALWLPALNVVVIRMYFISEFFLVEVIGLVIFALIWTTYLKKSVRVKNTYKLK